ncbi:MAG: DUF4129 domain-containing protein [Caldilineales bacterium]|nr:DUF4129 domain-containing protein [Caldilineales bacterium]
MVNSNHRARPIPWLRSGLLVALIGMELSWFTPLILSLHRRSWDFSPGWYLAGIAAMMAMMMLVAHFLSSRQVDSPQFELTVLAAILIMGLLLVRVYVFSAEPLLAMTWFSQAFFGSDPRRVDTILVLITFAFLWWRGVSFMQREIGFFTVAFDFRKGVLLLIVAIALYSFLSGRSANFFVYTFFFCSLVAVALGRVEDKARVSGGKGKAFDSLWLGIIVAAALALVGLGLLAARVWSLGSFRALGNLLRPLGSFLGPVIERSALAVLSLFEPVFILMIGVLQSVWGWILRGATQLRLIDNQDIAAQLEQAEIQTLTLPPWLARGLGYGIPLVFLALILFILVAKLQRRRAYRRGDGEPETVDAVFGVEGAGLAGLGRRLRRGLQERWARLTARSQLYAAISIRHIYANLLRLAERRGYPRQPAQTPNDFLPQLILAFPGQEENLRTVTAAYNAVEYGEIPTDPAELDRLRSAWRAIQTAPRADEMRSDEVESFTEHHV